jgi:hypothetical protein
MKAGTLSAPLHVLQAGTCAWTDEEVVLEFPVYLNDLRSLHLTVHSSCARGVSPNFITYTIHIQAQRNDWGLAQACRMTSRRQTKSPTILRKHDPSLERTIADSLRYMTPVVDAPAMPANDRDAVADVRYPSLRGAERLSDVGDRTTARYVANIVNLKVNE